jgi:hypothetical protein
MSNVYLKICKKNVDIFVKNNRKMRSREKQLDVNFNFFTY